MNNKHKQLEKKLARLYFSKEYGQKFTVTTLEVPSGERDDEFGIILVPNNKDFSFKNSIYLFSIQTLSYFDEYYRINKEYKLGHNDYVNQTSFWPLYNQKEKVFTLKKFGNITEEDVYWCAKYFFHKILDLFIFNIEVDFPKIERVNI